MELAGVARIGVLVDHASQIQALADAARTSGKSVDVYIEIDVGGNRCGIAPGEEAVQLAESIVSSPLRFAGLHCYHGPAQHLRTPQQRAAAIRDAAQLALKTRNCIEARGIPVGIVTGAGTGTFLLERDSGVYNELQCGSYVFMDRDYGDNTRGERDIAFEHALFVLTTVMSRATADKAIVDAGLKASSVDSGMPAVWQRSDLKYLNASDEHGVIATVAPSSVELGERLMLVPGHCDPTVNLYDSLICVRGGRVEALWPVAARGALL
jgi:D-serine deaminase-like pyridoxal phosphate-dependent protein